MNMIRKFIWFLAVLSISYNTSAQSGPGGIGDTTGNSSLKLWLTSSIGPSSTTPNAKVTQWIDRSGAGNNLGSGSNSEPVFINNVQNGFPGVKFSGSHYMQSIRTSSLANPELTMFIVIKNYNSGAALAVCDANTQFNNEFLMLNRQAYLHRSSGNFKYNKHQCSDSLGSDTCQVLAVRFNKGTNTIDNYINGSLSNASTQSAGGSFTFSNIDRLVTLGQRNSFVSGEYLNGTILEVITHNTALSSGQIDSINTYLINKYDLTSSPCSQFLALKEMDNIETLKVFPNPSTGLLNFEGLTAPGKLELYDINGRLVYYTQLRKGQQSVDLGTLSPALYSLRITTTSKVINKKILISK
ncbi:MAG: T9SS type A sorting domain-containing protein [Bacteroidia bacterium]